MISPFSKEEGSVDPQWELETGLRLYRCRVFSEVVGYGGGTPTLRHDWCGNGLLALPRGVDFAMESHPSTSVLGKEGVG